MKPRKKSIFKQNWRRVSSKKLHFGSRISVIAVIVFLREWGSSINWLKLKIEPPKANLTCINWQNTLYQALSPSFSGLHKLSQFTVEKSKQYTNCWYQNMFVIYSRICGPSQTSKCSPWSWKILTNFVINKTFKAEMSRNLSTLQKSKIQFASYTTVFFSEFKTYICKVTKL